MCLRTIQTELRRENKINNTINSLHLTLFNENVIWDAQWPNPKSESLVTSLPLGEFVEDKNVAFQELKRNMDHYKHHLSQLVE